MTYSETFTVFLSSSASILTYKSSIIYDDIRQTALLIATRGLLGTGDFALLKDGIKRLGSFIYENKYFIEDAIIDSAKAAYIATCIEKGVTNIQKYSLEAITQEMSIGTALPAKLNKLKKSRPEAFYYCYLIDNLI